MQNIINSSQESLLSQLSPKLLAAHNHNRVMAQLAGCQPIPLDSCQNVVSRPTTSVTRPTTSVTRASLMPLTIATSSSTYLCSPPKSEPMEMNSPGMKKLFCRLKAHSYIYWHFQSIYLALSKPS